MSVWGIALISVLGAAALLLAFFGRTRLSRDILIAGLALSGAGIGLGIGLVDGEGTQAQVVAASVVLAALTPLHVRVLLGPLGRKG
jgi:hypothetical protein